MIPILLFSGYSGSGKTTLMSSVVNILTKQGLSVATIKHDGSDHYLGEPLQGDSAKHKKAGAVCSIVSNSTTTVSVTDRNANATIQELFLLVPTGTDLILGEGFKSSELPKIEVHRSGKERLPLDTPNIIALATDDRKNAEIPVLDINDPEAVAAFVMEFYKANKQDISLHLIVNGEPVPTKGFLQNMLTYSIHGLIKALKGCEEPKEIIIKAKY
jgi:molybdopterin-guanine dinucleotide biosynthesis protein MobB